MINVFGSDEVKNSIINSVYNETISSFNLNDIFSIDLSFIDEHSIKELNNKSRGVNQTTDVLSFPYVNLMFPVDILDYPNDIDPDTGKIMLGEMMLCMGIIEEQSKLYGTSLERELAYMTVHGLLHLLGYDHMDDLRKREMRLKEETILFSIGYGKEE